MYGNDRSVYVRYSTYVAQKRGLSERRGGGGGGGKGMMKGHEYVSG